LSNGQQKSASLASTLAVGGLIRQHFALDCSGWLRYTIRVLEETVMAGKKKNQRPKGGTQRPLSDIPKFDLAEEIMAQQRKITGKKRKKRGAAVSSRSKKAEPVSRQQVEPTGHTIEQQGDVPFGQEQIIADIVARDIKRMLAGEGRNRS
jgi:hypothetical protein